MGLRNIQKKLEKIIGFFFRKFSIFWKLQLCTGSNVFVWVVNHLPNYTNLNSSLLDSFTITLSTAMILDGKCHQRRLICRCILCDCIFRHSKISKKKQLCISVSSVVECQVWWSKISFIFAWISIGTTSSCVVKAFRWKLYSVNSSITEALFTVRYKKRQIYAPHFFCYYKNNNKNRRERQNSLILKFKKWI